MKIDQQLAEIKQVVSDVLSLAKSKGATGAEASMSKVQGISVGSRKQEVETVEFTNDGGLGISVYVGNSKGSASTADLSPDALKMTVEKAIDIAKYTSDDKFNGLADAALMAHNPPDLDLYHPQALDTQKAIEMVIEAEASAFEFDARIINSDGANYSANLGLKVYGNSHGFIEGYPSSRYSLSCIVIGQQGDEMERDYDYTVSRQADQLLASAEVGRRAAQNTINHLGARKIPTAKVPVLFQADTASSLFGHFISAISGGNLYRKSSFLLDKLGQSVFPNWLTIQEKPHLLRGLASSPFDNEGVSTSDMNIVEQGQLIQYLLTSYSARKLGMQTNGHAGGIHNWQVSSNGGDFAQMLNQLGTGLLVTDLMGQGVNTVTGDYSRGASGFWVENGQIQYPVNEITIAGNLMDMFQGIQSIGSDIETRGAIQTGSILIDKMQVAGE